jgi:hypothetical protein
MGDFDAVFLKGKRHLSGEQPTRRFSRLARHGQFLFLGDLKGMLEGIELEFQISEEQACIRTLLLQEYRGDEIGGVQIGDTQEQPQARQRSIPFI